MEAPAAATSRPQLAPRGAAPESPAPEPQPVVGVVLVRTHRPETEEIAQLRLGAPVVLSIPKDGDAPPANLPPGVHIVESAPGSGPGRMRNAGYRVLKKEIPHLAFVQFLDEDATLDPAWLGTATRFMQRRPEVAVLAGQPGAPVDGARQEVGEVKTVGRSFLIRAEAFEAAGGFRGDLVVNEIADLCVRLRRRGAHVWTLADRMTAAEARRPKSWWTRARDAGYANAHGARLHGAPPERLFVREHLSALLWGAAAPAFFFMSATALGAFFLLRGERMSALLGVVAALGLGGLLYVARIAVMAMRSGGAVQAWRRAAEATIGQFAEFLGACRFYLSGVDPRRNAAP